jgi:hypothetical protein
MKKIHFAIFMLLVIALVVSGCATQKSDGNTTNQSTSEHQTKSVEVEGYFIRVGKQLVFCGGSKIAKDLTENELRNYFKNGVRVQESKAINKNAHVLVYVINSSQNFSKSFAPVTIRVKQANVQQSVTSVMTVDLADTKGIPVLNITTFRVNR